MPAVHPAPPTHPKYIVYVEVIEYTPDGKSLSTFAGSCQCESLDHAPSSAKIAVEISEGYKKALKYTA